MVQRTMLLLSMIACSAAVGGGLRGPSSDSFVGSDNEFISIGDSVVWERGDGSIARNAIGRVTRIESSGAGVRKAVTAFKGGVKRKLASSEVRKLPQFTIGESVTWDRSDGEVARGSIGKVMRFDAKLGHPVVSFPKGIRKKINPIELRKLPTLRVGSKVAAASGHGDESGEFIRMDGQGKAVVKFKGGKRDRISPDQLRNVDDFKVSDEVTWPGSDSTIPHGAVGQIIRMDAKGNAVVKYAGGKKKHIATAALQHIRKVKVNDEVAWTKSDSETPRGSIGQVVRIDSKGNAVVRFARGQKRHLPVSELAVHK